MKKIHFNLLFYTLIIAILHLGNSHLTAMEVAHDSKPTPSLPKSFTFLTAALEFSEDYEKEAKAHKLFVSISPQPDIMDLRNQFDTDGKDCFYQWLRKRDTIHQPYKTALADYQKILKALLKDPNPQDDQTMVARDEATIRLTLERSKLIGPQGYYCTLGADQLDHLIFNSSFSPRANFKKKRTLHSLRTKAQDLTGDRRVVGFTLSPMEIKIQLPGFKRLILRLERELFALDQVLLFHQRNFITAVNGWTLDQLANWMELGEHVTNVQLDIDEAVRRKFDPSYPEPPQSFAKFARDLSTPRGRVLAKLNCDELGRHLVKFYNSILKIHPVNITPVEDIEFHKTAYQPVLDELKKLHLERKEWIHPEFDFDNREQILKKTRYSQYSCEATARWAYEASMLKEYTELLEKYSALLEEQRELHLKLHIQPTFLIFKSYIPSPWELFFTSQKPKAITPEMNTIDLSAAELKEYDLAVFEDEENLLPHQSILHPYQNVNLSHNKGLFGAVNYGFSSLLKSLNLSHCHISSLKCVMGLEHLEHLDVSYNQLKLTDGDSDSLGFLRNLTHLNISHNHLEGVDALRSIIGLIELDISDNQIQTICTLDAPHLRILRVARNPLNGRLWSLLPSELTTISLIDLSDCGPHLVLPNDSAIPSEFKEKFPTICQLEGIPPSTIAW